MVFIGFGFLMVFLKTFSWSAVGFTYICSAFAIECFILFNGFWKGACTSFKMIPMNIETMINADFCAAAVMISFGALLGKVNLTQMLVITCLESFFYAINLNILQYKLGSNDQGGTMTIHMFGAYFGLAASYFFHNKKSIGHK
jgi:ammonium transporter Rh